MPRNPPQPQPRGPSLTPEQARVQLQNCLDRAKRLLQQQPLTEERFVVWETNTFETLKAAFGETSHHLHTFIGPQQFQVDTGYTTPDYILDRKRREELTKQIEFLGALMEELPTTDIQAQNTGSDFFSALDSDIRRVSQQLFKDEHYADSVSAAFKELNHKVKQAYKAHRGIELDGADLMRKAFSPNNPVFAIADLSTESGKNTQQGFMELFAGAMIGIRNPHAHENLILDSEDAKHFLYLASLLMKKFKKVP